MIGPALVVRSWATALGFAACIAAPGCRAAPLSPAETVRAADDGTTAKASASPIVSRATGAVLVPAPLPDEFAATHEARLADARARLDADPTDLEAAIWVGRHLGYLARYRESIAHYTAMLERFGGEPRLLRHRGHRWITVRDFDAAIADLERAAAAVDGLDDRVEEDGLPNARNQPTSSLKTNIHYHLGLAYFLERRFEEAERAYRECLRHGTNPDMEAATRQWLFATLVRRNQWADARAVVEPVGADWDIIENDAYHQLLLMAKGERELDALATGASDEADQPSSAAIRFGLAHFVVYVGSADALVARARGEDVPTGAARAAGSMESLAADPGWAAFGVIAAEMEVADARTPD